MKKRILLIFAVILFSAGLIMVSREFQRNQNEAVSKTALEKNTETAKESGTPQDKVGLGEQQKIENNKTTQKSGEKKDSSTGKISEVKPNFIIKDDVKGEQILSMKIDFSGRTAEEATMQVLREKGIRFKATGSGDTFYISMIDNIRERDEGPQSGWCYFVDGRKYSIGAGTYKLSGNEILEWKFLKDGITP